MAASFKMWPGWRKFRAKSLFSTETVQTHGQSVTQSPKSNTIKDSWNSVVGLEIHAQILAACKMFSGAKVQFGMPPNSLVSYHDASLPGTLPVLNRRCVEAGVLTALALNCRINRVSLFDRKHYFYADLPAGYQITQQRRPLAVDGQIRYVTYDRRQKRLAEHSVRLHQLQLEVDSGKSLHDQENHETLVDLNRAGIGLMEIVTEPDLQNGSQAAALVKELQSLLKCVGTCDGQLSEGSMRVDANVSVNRPGEPLGVRTEIKNIGSISLVKLAVDYEIQRQIAAREEGEEIQSETRSVDYRTGKTLAVRDKESLQDYRFIPEPNLPPLVLDDQPTPPHSAPPGPGQGAVSVAEMEAQLPELPWAKRQRFRQHYGLSDLQILKMMEVEGLADYFDQMMGGGSMEWKLAKPEKVVGWLLTAFLEHLHLLQLEVGQCPVPAVIQGELIYLMEQEIISRNTGKNILKLLLEGDNRSIHQIISSNQWSLIKDKHELSEVIDQVMGEQADLVRECRRGGRKRDVQALTQHVHQALQGRGHPELVNQLLAEKLGER